MNNISYKSPVQYQLLFLFLVLSSVLFTDSYVLIYSIFSLFLISLFINQNNVIAKLFALFFIFYYVIPLPNISTYRGTIGIVTLKFYTLMMLVAILPLITKLGAKSNKTKTEYKSIRIGVFFKSVVLLHLFLVFSLMLYILITIGNIFVNQELRLQLSPVIGYILKSTIYISFFYFFLPRKSRGKLVNVSLFVILPIIPPIFIGSRGVAILAIMGLVMLAIIKTFRNGEDYYLNLRNDWKKYIPLAKYASIVVFALLQGVYYLRRYNSNTLLSAKELALEYFGSDAWYYYLIMPLHFTFREIVGLTNTIIERNIENPIETPLFIAELITILPGEQPAPGRVLGSIVGTTLEAGLTPGILGALYIDFKWFSVAIIFLFMMLIQILKKKSLYSDYYKILFCLTTVQFLHLFHRGFIKPEYIVAYLVVMGYYFLSRVKIADHHGY